MTYTIEQQRSYDRLHDAFKAHGYFISAEPIDGMETVFLTDLLQAFKKVEKEAAFMRRHYGYRGLSKKLLEELHNSLPAPSWNVESAIAPELRAKENRAR